MAHFALAWCVFLAWAGATFTMLERVWARHTGRPAPRRIAIAALLLAIDGAIARVVVSSSPDPQPVARLVLAWLFAEILLYWVHRAMHRVPALWRFHRLHHDGEPLAWVTAWYVHPVDAALFASCAMLGGVLAGSGAPGAAWFIVGRRAWTVLLHANLAWSSSVLDRLIATPPFHHRHHREDLAPANFASTLPVLDRLFGTCSWTSVVLPGDGRAGIGAGPLTEALPGVRSNSLVMTVRSVRQHSVRQHSVRKHSVRKH